MGEDEEDEPSDPEDSSDDEGGMENRGMINEEMEADELDGGAASQNQEGPAAAMLGDDGDDIGIAEARAEVRHNQEMEEAKQELDDLKGSDDDEAVYEGNGERPEGGAEGSQEGASEVVVGQKRGRDPAQNNETKALDLRKLKR